MIRTVMHRISMTSFAKECKGGRCPVCGLPARNMDDVRDESLYVACRRCGGFKYYISQSEIEDCCKKHDVLVGYGRALISYITWDENALGNIEMALQNGIEARGLSVL